MTRLTCLEGSQAVDRVNAFDTHVERQQKQVTLKCHFFKKKVIVNITAFQERKRLHYW